MNEVLLDTDTLSFYLRNIPKVTANCNYYLKFHKGFTFSVITNFEILRGLKIKNAQRQITKFDLIRQYSKEIELSDRISSAPPKFTPICTNADRSFSMPIF